MCVWDNLQQVPRIYGITWRDQSQSRKYPSMRQMGAPRMAKEVQRLIGREPPSIDSSLDRLSSACPFAKCWRSQRTSSGPMNARRYSRGALHSLASSRQAKNCSCTLWSFPRPLDQCWFRRKTNLKASLPYQQSAQNIKTWYPRLEKLIFILIVLAIRLRPYFHAYTMVVLTD